MVKNDHEILFALFIILFGIINLLWSHYSDYIFYYWIAENYYNINLSDYWANWYNNKNTEKDILVLNSLYFEKNLLTLPIYFAAFFGSGYIATQILFDLVNRKKLKKILIIGFIIFWLIKIPVEYSYSTIPGTEAGLFAW